MVLFWCIQAAADARFGSKGVGVSLCQGLNACRGVALSEGCTAAHSLLFLFSLAQTCAAVTRDFSTYQPYLSEMPEKCSWHKLLHYFNLNIYNN